MSEGAYQHYARAELHDYDTTLEQVPASVFLVPVSPLHHLVTHSIYFTLITEV